MIRNADDSAFPATLDADVAIIGAGAAGLALALALANSRLSVVVLAGGGETEDPVTQGLYDGEVVGAAYEPLSSVRARILGGTTSRWAGWCAPLRQHDFAARGWINQSGWPIRALDVEPYLAQAARLADIDDATFDDAALSQVAAAGAAPVLPVIHGGIETRL
nr:FAD-binding protein [Micropepsaceae bacterium]